jgi:hypothetical protein
MRSERRSFFWKPTSIARRRAIERSDIWTRIAGTMGWIERKGTRMLEAEPIRHAI